MIASQRVLLLILSSPRVSVKSTSLPGAPKFSDLNSLTISCLLFSFCGDPSAHRYSKGEIFVSSETGMDYNHWKGAGSEEFPFATIDYAISQCDRVFPCTIVVLAGHEETAEYIELNGTSIIGLGQRELRPVITLTGAKYE